MNLRRILNIGLLVIFLAGFWLTSYGQRTQLPPSEVEAYHQALDLFTREMYGAAFDGFQEIRKKNKDPRAELAVNAQYYEALCALQLFNRDAEHLLTTFVEEHPQSPFVRSVYFQLGRYNYRKRKYDKTIEWLERVDVYDLSLEELPEYYFELGYSYFREQNYKRSAQLLYEIKDDESAYQGPARYYYAHMAYLDGKLETALIDFQNLLDHPIFGSVVPYYISQIYFLQGKDQKLIDFATPLLDSVVPKREAEVAHLLGQSHYRLGHYGQAIPYLERFHQKSNRASREDHYSLGFAYYRNKQYREALGQFSKVYSLEKDSLAQITLYQMGESYVQLGQKQKAIPLFDQVYELGIDPQLTEDALYTYAKLSYETAYDPYNKAIKAFKEFIFRYPNSPRADEAYDYLLNAYLTTKDYDLALSSIEEIPAPDPRLQEAHQTIAFNKGAELYHSANYPEAINYFKRSRNFLVNKELNALSLYWTAEAYFKRKNYKSAIKNYSDFYYAPGAILLPQFNKANYNIGYANYRLGKDYYGEALKSFRKFVQYTKEQDKLFLNDAYLRIGDLFFLDQNYSQSITYYEQAAQLRQFDTDYAKFQIAVGQGLMRQYQEKENALLSLVNTYPKSQLIDDAKYHLGLNAEKLGNNSGAQNYYDQLISEYPESPFLRKALVNSGYIHFRENDLDKAFETFDRVVKEFSNYGDKQEALRGIELVLTEQDRLDYYAEYLQAQDIDVSESHLDSITFLAHEQNYLDGRFENSVKNFDSYLKRFKNPIFALNAHFYKGQLLFKNLLYEDALEDFEYVINSEPNEFTEQSLDKAAYILFADQEYERALPYFEQLAKIGSDAGALERAEEGAMRCHFRLKNHTQALSYANAILKRPEVRQPLFVEIQFDRGKSAFALDDLDQAWEAFSISADTLPNEKGAEAKYHLAYIRFLQDDYTDTETHVRELVQEFGGYHDWVAKGLILLSDVYAATGDAFQAIATLESIVNNFDGDPVIATDAQRKLDALIEATKEPEPEEEDDVEVEFNDSEFDTDELFEEEVIEEDDLQGGSSDR